MFTVARLHFDLYNYSEQQSHYGCKLPNFNVPWLNDLVLHRWAAPGYIGPHRRSPIGRS